MDDSFKSLVEQSTSVLVLLPTKPFFDQVAAGLGLYLSLQDRKQVAISCPTPMTVEFNRLVGVNKIATELGDKNLVIKFVDYNAQDVERVSADIEGGEFYLSVIPKPGALAPKKGQIQFSYSGVSYDTAILVGGVNESHFPALSSNDLVGVKHIHIGVRALSTSTDRKVISFASPASSVSELVASLIKESGFSMDVDAATNLLMGIEEGSNKFTGGDVSANTFQAVADLMRAGGRRRGPPSSRPTLVAEKPQKVFKKFEAKKPPKDWLTPKVYKGTTIS